MTSSDAPSGFPSFSDGDVAIVVSIRRTYRLHSHTLRQKSSYFAHNLQPSPKTPRWTPAMKRAGLTRWRFQLYQNPQNEGEIGSFIPVAISETGRIERNDIPLRVPPNTVSSDDGDNCWEWLFGCFYGRKPNFDSTTFGATVNDCVALVEIADSIGAIGAVREAVDLALLQQDGVLWKSVASSPIIWAELGRRVRSPAIFKEAIIHIVGQWKMLDPQTRDALPAGIYKLCDEKFENLEMAKRAVEIRMAGHYPAFLCKKVEDRPQRTTYANEIYMWMAISHFRHYISQSGNDGQNRMAVDGGYSWYKKFATGGDSYLDHEDMKAFHQYFPMSGKACGVFEAHMNVLKEEIKPFVRGLMVNRTHIDPEKLEGAGQPWLTCTQVKLSDMPWDQGNEDVQSATALPLLSAADFEGDVEAKE